jgi:hypothetical protein
MSVTTISVGRFRPPAPAIAIVQAVLAAITLAVLTIADTTRTGSSPEAPTPAADHAPTPYWLQQYLQFEAPAADHAPTPYWLQQYLQFEAPASDTAAPS